MPDLLIELFSEEIPARMQARAREDLKRLVTEGLVQAGLTYAGAGAFSTPRRLTLTVEGLPPHSPTTREERKGPRTDAPEKALEGFLRSTGLTRDQLDARDDKKGQVWFATITQPGRPAAQIVAEVLETAIRTFPWPKSMRWGAGSLRWVRPLHSILCILSDEAGADIVPLTVDGITAANTTRGHRFMAPDAFAVTGFEDYATKLRRARVMLDADERASEIRSQAENLAFARGWQIVPDEALLAEVAGLVEWPVPLMGVIEDRFLALPPEVLQTSMKEHQKFFSARNPRTGRIEGFVTVANIETPDDGATIMAGNQRVLAARLSDAAFFWKNDLREAKSGMTAWADGLTSVTFHNKLGSQADRIERIAALAREIAPLVGADPDQAERAARLAKLDLRSAMVGEFPELQGTMGRYYALEAGEPDAVADAARDHYAPLGPSDAVPTAPVSVAVALADKIDTLTGFWAIDEKPTGSKDPYALRRAALGVIRLLKENAVTANLSLLLERPFARNWYVPSQAVQAAVLPQGQSPEASNWIQLAVIAQEYDDSTYAFPFMEFLAALQRDAVCSISDKWFENQTNQPLQGDARKTQGDQRLKLAIRDLISFLHDRLKGHLRDQGIRHDIIDAVLAQEGNDDLVQIMNRATALNAMLQTEDGKNLTQGLKRAGNILAQAEEKDGVEYSFGADIKFAETDEERALFTALDTATPAIRRAMATEDFPAAMSAIAALRSPIDAFFEAVQVNTDSQILRRNRLNLLSRIRDAGRQIADFTRIEG
ncbi:glycine--tRNA ligase subunit beta [Paracoccus liaowanqingii]|uniref:Glycine--tRNA ligase beta subunit n=1 Tax=Paracoccus liaowanqingii TaxID=2560053 RepID=A0A4Z1CQX0_9RHOB|nr:glycine--tRNA ligase subunit beta [Paracoccus liaowanqingii]TGN67350.1 glycine--tRNA ligase subunit beta [Paracoccus liaowanqingii]